MCPSYFYPVSAGNPALHPQALIRILPVDWPYTIPFGILYPWDPSQQILLFLEAVKQVLLV